MVHYEGDISEGRGPAHPREPAVQRGGSSVLRGEERAGPGVAGDQEGADDTFLSIRFERKE